MLQWIGENFASLVLLLLVAAIIFFLLRSKIRETKKGNCGCGCQGCSGCAAHRKKGGNT